MNEHHEIDSYLRRLDSELRGPSHYRSQMLVEIRTHLCDITDAADCSAADAVERFGDADELVRQLNQVLAVKRRRSTRRIATGIAAGVAVALAAGGIPGTGHGRQLAAPPNAGTSHVSATIDPGTGIILAIHPLSGAEARSRP